MGLNIYVVGGCQVVLVVKNLPANARDPGDAGSVLNWEDHLEEGMATHPSILACEPHGQRILAGYSLQGHTGSDTTEAT